MPKVSGLLELYAREYQFLTLENGNLLCKFCAIKVQGKKSSIEQHKNSFKHQSKESKKETKVQPTVETSFKKGLESTSKSIYFKERLTETLMKANIPLRKLNDENMKNFINEFTTFNCPDESTCRKLYVDKLYFKKLRKLQDLSCGKRIYLVLDETTDSQQRMVLNVMVGILSNDIQDMMSPFLLSTTFLKNACNHQTVNEALVNSLSILYSDSIRFEDILLIITDGAPYMVKAIHLFQETFSGKTLHVTCLVHGLHRVAESVRACLPLLDTFISKMKKVLLKSPRRRALFTEMTELPLPPQPSIVRWGTWLHAANYYAQNFEKVKQFIAAVSEDSVAVSDAKDIFKNKEEAIKADLINVASNYFPIAHSIKKLETENLSLEEQIRVVEDLQGKLPTNSSPAAKMKMVLEKNSGYEKFLCIRTLLSGSSGTVSENTVLKGLSPCDILNLKYAPLTSVCVERSFSKYKDLLTVHRNRFTEESLKRHLFVQINKTL